MPRYAYLALKMAIIESQREQQEIAAAARMTPPALSHALHGRRVLRPVEQKRLAEALQRSVDEIFPAAPPLPLPRPEKPTEAAS